MVSNLNGGWSHFSHKLWSSRDTLFILKVKILMLIKWSYSTLPLPHIILTIEPQMVIIFWAHTLFSFRHVYSWYMFLEPHLTTCHSNIGGRLREGSKLVTSTLFPCKCNTVDPKYYGDSSCMTYKWPRTCITHIVWKRVEPT